MKKEWFAGWFDSPFYHILYQNYNEKDAQDFLDNLLHHLTPLNNEHNEAQNSKPRVLDLACGKGRHSIYMASKGFDVTGLDLSKKSIKYAQKFENDYLSFFEHDMRHPFRINYFDFIFNIFTSFGYFEKETDNLKSLINVRNGLKQDGIFILDYFNSAWVRATMKPDYIQTSGGIDFHIKKRITDDGHIIKEIEFESEGKEYRFQEKVRLFTEGEFDKLFDDAGLKIIQKFGDYNLNSFDINSSNRLIIKAIRK